MAARRGKSQARRNGGNSAGLPGWAWLVLGVVITIIVVMVAPKLLKGDGDGFLRPHANPDAQPTPVAVEDDELLPADTSTATTKPADANAKPEGSDAKNPEYDFYTLLPGKEVPMTDAELAATEKAEAERQARQQGTAAAPSSTSPATTAAPAPGTTASPASASASRVEPLPAPVSEETPERTATASKPSEPASTAAKPTAPSDDTRYLLQAGAFQASGQAEELKAKIAMLGLGARVESAQLKGQTVYRVRMGPYGTASDLAEAKRKLSSGGLTAMAIKVE